MNCYFTTIGDHILRFDTDARWAGMWLAFHLQAVERSKLRSPRLLDLQADLTVRVEAGGAPAREGGVRVRWEDEGRLARIPAPDESALSAAVLAAYGAFILRREWGLLLYAEAAARGAVCELHVTGAADRLALVKVGGGGAFVYDSPFAGGARLQAESLPLPLAAVRWRSRAGRAADAGDAAAPLATAEASARLRRIAAAGERDGEAERQLSLLCRRLAEQVPVYEPAASPLPPPPDRRRTIRR